MMGHINRLLLGMVQQHHGDEGVKRLFALAKLPATDYRPEVVYPEAEFQVLYRAAKELYGADDEGTQKAFAAYFCEVSPKMFPMIFEEAGSARGLFEKVPLIHKQWPSAASAADFREKLWVTTSAEERIVFKYNSPNQLCWVLRYVSEGILTYYSEHGVVTETQCARQGAEFCLVEVRFGANV